jgi:hypothetical protein
MPDGQISARGAVCLSSLNFGFSENISLPAWPKSHLDLLLSRPTEGRSRSSRTRGGMRWTQMVLLTRAPACGRRSRVVLTPRRRRQVSGGNSADDGDKKADHRGARRKPLKPLRAGMPGYSGATVVTNSCAFYTLRTRLRVHWAPGIPRALVWAKRHVQLGRIVPREGGCVSAVFETAPRRSKPRIRHPEVRARRRERRRF